MKLHTLRPAEGSHRKPRRIGRGQGSGKGGTSTRGHKGQSSRSGGYTKRGFEGGQMPLQRRLPKFGFKNPFRKEYSIINLEKLQMWVDADPSLTKVDIAWLIQKGEISKNAPLVKILGEGELNKSLAIEAHKFSKTAQAAIEKAGGSVRVLERTKAEPATKE